MPTDKFPIDVSLVSWLVATQFPQWDDCPSRLLHTVGGITRRFISARR